ncbi:MAG: uroporphyrinogen decarboxylase family protein, partial [Candidatus Latescibacteria bacterium]|nr:uroporphyrinogen decarboxylase family protein [Candidatus Latescibacterota bacterium]
MDWIDGMARCLEEPSLIYDYVIRLVEELDCDGLRLFVKGDPLAVRRQDDRLVAFDPATGDRKGMIDLHGGGYLVPDDPPPPIESLAEAKERCKQAEDTYSDEKLELFELARARVPQRFVASSVLGFTLNTYISLRGREQAMMDLIDRPDFVAAVIDVQVETAIRLAERLLPTGIDSFYIGDPSSSSGLISPQHFETFCLPAFQTFCNHFASHDVLIYIHVCGNSEPILEMLADSGAHTVEPLDPLGGVSVADAKRRIGDRVALMGGLDTLTLANGTPEEVRDEAIRKCREGGPHGYVLAAGDMVPPATSLENLRAMVQVAKDGIWK